MTTHLSPPESTVHRNMLALPDPTAGACKLVSWRRLLQWKPGKTIVSELGAFTTVLCATVLTSGCGSGGLGFTGGSIPIGKAVIIGTVVRAEQASIPMGGATITAVAKTTEGKSTVLQAISGSDGTFTLVDVPTGAASPQIEIDVSVPRDSKRYGQHLSFQLSVGGKANMIAALPSLDAGIEGATTLSITAVSRARLGQRIRIYSHLKNNRGLPLHLIPSVVYIGGNARLVGVGTNTSIANSNGIESSIYLDTQKEGSGSVTAYLYNGEPSVPVVITADPQAPIVPTGN